MSDLIAVRLKNKEKLVKEAENQGRTLSGLINYVMTKYLKEKDLKND